MKSPRALHLGMTSKPGKLGGQEQAKKGTRKAARTHVLALLVDTAVMTCLGRKLPAGRSVRLKRVGFKSVRSEHRKDLECGGELGHGTQEPFLMDPFSPSTGVDGGTFLGLGVFQPGESGGQCDGEQHVGGALSRSVVHSGESSRRSGSRCRPAARKEAIPGHETGRGCVTAYWVILQGC